MGYNQWEMKSFLRELGITLALGLVIFLILHAAIESFVVFEYCMEPNFEPGQRLMVNKMAYRFGEPQRGDVIILRPPITTEAVFIKRVVGLPGDTVAAHDGALYVNGTRLDEPYLYEPITYTLTERTIREGEYFVLGDNRNIANDSHRGWTLPREDIIGKVWLTYWPLGDFGLVGHYPLAEQLASAEATGG